MIIYRPVDIEEEIRRALADYFTVYVRPLPANFAVPSLLITATGGTSKNKIDTFTVVIDARAETDAEADELARNALGTLQALASQQTGALSFMEVNALANWKTDPVRPELKMRTITAQFPAHREEYEITKGA